MAALLSVCLFGGCRERIVHDLTETEANRLTAQLYQAGAVPAKVQQANGKWAVAVPKSDAARVMQFLQDARLLREGGVEPAATSSMLQSRDEQRFKFERSLSREIEETLASIDGAFQVRVHLNLPVRDPFLGQVLSPQEKGSASVLLVAGAGFPMTKEQVRELVAGAAGISPEKVAVLVNKADPLGYIRSRRRLLPHTRFERLAKRFWGDLHFQVLVSLLIILSGGLWVIRSSKGKRSRKFADIAKTLRREEGDAAG